MAAALAAEATQRTSVEVQTEPLVTLVSSIELLLVDEDPATIVGEYGILDNAEDTAAPLTAVQRILQKTSPHRLQLQHLMETNGQSASEFGVVNDVRALLRSDEML